MLHTPGGTVHARTIVLATNAWLPELGTLVGANWLSSCIIPTRGQVIATEPISEQLFPCPCSADEGYQYWRQLSDGRLVVGGWRNRSFDTELQTYDETPNEGIQRHLDAFVHETLKLPQVGIANRWAGIMGFTADSLPLIGRLPGVPQCFIAGGFGTVDKLRDLSYTILNFLERYTGCDGKARTKTLARGRSGP